MQPDSQRVAGVAAAVQRFQRMRSGKAAHTALVAAADVSITQQSLHLLLAVDGEASASDLARSLNMDAGAVSRELRRMEDDSLIERTQTPGQAAGAAISLTLHGSDVRDRIVAVRNAHLAHALADWDAKSAATFAELLERFVDDLQATPLSESNGD